MFQKVAAIFRSFKQTTQSSAAAPLERAPRSIDEAISAAKMFLNERWPGLADHAHDEALQNAGVGPWQLRSPSKVMESDFQEFEEGALEAAMAELLDPVLIEQGMSVAETQHVRNRFVVTVEPAPITPQGPLDKSTTVQGARVHKAIARAQRSHQLVAAVWPNYSTDVRHQVWGAADETELTVTSPELNGEISGETVNALWEQLALILRVEGEGMQLKAVAVNGRVEAQILNPTAETRRKAAAAVSAGGPKAAVPVLMPRGPLFDERPLANSEVGAVPAGRR